MAVGVQIEGLGLFDAADALGLQRVAAVIAAGCDWAVAGIDGY